MHVTHHEGSPRPDGDWGFLVYIAGAVGALILIIIYLPYIIATLVALGLTSTAAALGWRLTKLQRKRLELWWLKRKLDGTIRRYTDGKVTIQTLSEADRDLANKQLEKVLEVGRAVCKQLRELKVELTTAKEAVMSKLGDISTDALAAKLAPFTALETEIERAISGFEHTGETGASTSDGGV